MGSEYICGPVINATNSEEALSQVQPLHNFALEVAMSDGVVCAPRYGATVTEVSIMLIITMVSFTILGYALNRKPKVEIK